MIGLVARVAKREWPCGSMSSAWSGLMAFALGLASLACTPTVLAADVTGNLLLKRPYALSSPTNYKTASAGQKSLLTDGKPASGDFLRNGTALGWTWKTHVKVSVKLRAPAAVGSVLVQAGAKKRGEAFFPSQFVVYGGDGSGRYTFLGASTLQSDDASPYGASLRKFGIDLQPRIVDELVVVVFARGAYIFLGEIEALAAKAGSAPVMNIASDALLYADAVKRRRMAIAALPGPKPFGPDAARRWAMPIDDDARGLDTARDIGPVGCSIERIEPWSEEPGMEDLIAPDAPLLTMAGGDDFAAFQVVNRTNEPAQISVSSTVPPSIETKTFALSYAQALNYAFIADVVVPFDRKKMLPRRSKMALLVRVSSAAAGRTRLQFQMQCGNGSRTFDVPLRTFPVDTTVKPLRGNLWTYIHERQHAPVARAIACDANFLARHGIDSVVVHPKALLDNGRTRPTRLLRRYLRAYRDASRVLLFMNVKGWPWAFKRLPAPAAQRSLKAWWEWVQSVAKAEGVKGELLLYPVDEPREADVPLLLRTIELLRRAGVTARSYSTVDENVALMLTSLDIQQFLRPTQHWKSLLNVGELHSYDTRLDGRLLSANRYYRMQGWRAYDMRLHGVGIWAGWDTSGLADPASGWNPFTGHGERDLGMIYASPEGCGWPSRRLLAWKRGIDENRMLRTCASRRDARPGGALGTAIATGNSRAVRAKLERICEP